MEAPASTPDLDRVLLAAVARALAIPTMPRQSGLCDWQIKRIVRLIDERIDQPIRVRDLAGAVRLSPSHFSRAFNRSLGTSPHAFVLGRRIAHARQLISTTAVPLSDIAFRCGLADQSHLCRAFRRETGTTPAAWRRQSLGAAERGTLSLEANSLMIG
ncbi:MAG TPA: AraC family transcriptional regulator [Reyranella sp.]|jgi:AraC-like DNA-binding protein